MNATALAHERNLLPKNQLLECEFKDMCNRVDCIKLSEPNYRTIHLKQGNIEDSVSPIAKFYIRLIKRKETVSNK